MSLIDGQILTADGAVSEAHERIGRIINEYDPTLELAWIPPSQRNPFDPKEKPWAIMCSPVGAPPYIVLTSDHCDERLLAEVFKHDSNRTDILADLEAHNAAVQAVELKKRLDAQEYRQDFIQSVVKSPLHTVRHNGRKFRK